MGNSRKQKIVNTFEGGINKDVLPSMQPANTYRYALNAVKKTDTESNFGLATESSTQLHTALPSGYDVRGLVYSEENDKYVVFLHNGANNQIGIIDEKLRTYTEIVNDENSKNQLQFSFDEWIDATIKYETKGQCKHLMVYWSNNNVYKYADLDDKCCDYSKIILFDCQCADIVVAELQESGGRLYNGAYQFAIQLEDADGNTTNYSKISNPIYVTSDDNIAGELSNKSINLSIKNLSSNYSRVNIAIIKTINGIETVKVIKNVNYGGTKLSYLYTGDTGREIDTSLTEILGRSNRYVKGKNLMQYDGRLVLYNTIPYFNTNLMPIARNAKVSWVAYIVPTNEAHRYRGLKRSENYLFSVKENYCDNTSSASFVFFNRDATAGEQILVNPSTDTNCSTCDVPMWKVKDTSKVTKWYYPDIHQNFINGGFEPNMIAAVVPREAEPDTSVQNDEVPIDDIPKFDEMIKDALNTRHEETDEMLRCACDKLKDALNNLPINEKSIAMADSGVVMLLCQCENIP